MFFITVLIASCGGGSSTTTTSTTTTVINGVSVPPEPDPVRNNSTIAGVDSNNNGVRDDVERKAAEISQNDTNKNRTIVIAKMVQNQISSTSPQLTIDEWRIIMCETGGIDLTINTVINTPERWRAAGNMPPQDIPDISCGN